jgi:hypothetical protein
MASQQLRSLRWQIVRVVRRAAARVDRVVGRRVAKAVKAVPAANKGAPAVVRRVARADRVAVRAVVVRVAAEAGKVPAAVRRVARAGKGADRAVVVRVVGAGKVPVVGRRVAKAGKGADRAARVVAKAVPGAARKVAKANASRAASGAKKFRHTARGQSWRLAPSDITSDRERASSSDLTDDVECEAGYV